MAQKVVLYTCCSRHLKSDPYKNLISSSSSIKHLVCMSTGSLDISSTDKQTQAKTLSPNLKAADWRQVIKKTKAQAWFPIGECDKHHLADHICLTTRWL